MAHRESILHYIKMFPYSEGYSYLPSLFDDFENLKPDYAVASKEEQNAMVDAFLESKLDWHRWNLKSLKGLLLSRLDIHYDNNRTIEERIGEHHNHLRQILEFPGGGSSEMMQRRTELDKLIVGLYQQINLEKTNLWRDLNLLQRDVAMGVKYYNTFRNALIQ
jgi:hypothetical protein